MNFIKKILKTKKIRKAEKELRRISEKYQVSEKIEDAGEKISDVVENVGDKIENFLDEKINFDDFMKIEIKVGKIIEAEEIKKSDKLLKLKVDFGKKDVRQIISGIKKSYSVKEILNKKATFVTNLAPRKIMGLESDGMILGVSEKDNFSILSPEKEDINEGAIAG